MLMKIQKKQFIKITRLILIITAFFSPFGSYFIKNQNTYLIHPSLEIFSSEISDMSSAPSIGYSYRTNITYNLQYNWTFWYGSMATENVEMWFPLIQNHTHPQMSGVGPQQESNLLLNVSNYEDFSLPDYNFDPEDDYNNSYEYFGINLNQYSQDFSYNSSYDITLRELVWDVDSNNIGEYDPIDPLFVNNTGPEDYLNTLDPDLIDLSNEICLGKSTVLAKARAVYDWMIDDNNLVYDIQNVEQSASDFYISRVGDCSEFSNLMVTLLRIQDIPARKVVGLTILDGNLEDGFKPIKNPIKGQSWYYVEKFRYNQEIIELNIPGHAWIEYYIPGYGWIPCDPTWGYGGGDYFNRIDASHITWNVGQNFGGGIDPQLPGTATEMSIVPSLWCNQIDQVAFDLEIRVKVLNSEYYYNSTLWILVAVLIIVSIVSLIIYVTIRSRQKKQLETAY
ncbi:MAG: hypothetical protein GF364_20865 [Candidatus Lokiarchaeota archaeon]|nr:hypothetical protein [Candidatus Lokiarchaeota archaeon]